MSQHNIAAHGIITKISPHSVEVTTEKLATILQSKDFVIFAEVDHQAGAAKAGLSLAPTRTVIFGNPQGGTPLMQSAISAALDLPLKIAIYENTKGKTEIAYNQPQWLADRHNIDNCDAVIEKITTALDAMTNAVTE